MRKNTTIEIINDDPSGCRGLTIWEARKWEQSTPIARDVDEGQIEEVLTPKQMAKYERGAYRFTVPSAALTAQFDYLPR